MERQLKFRAWDTIHKRFEECLYINFIGEVYSDLDKHGIDMSGNRKIRMTPDRFVIMQFTGLKDKNGVEIYQSDILLPDNMLVVWREDLASFALRKKGWMYDHYFKEAIEAKDCEVIGNLYSNPDLLTTNKD